MKFHLIRPIFCVAVDSPRCRLILDYGAERGCTLWAIFESTHLLRGPTRPHESWWIFIPVSPFAAATFNCLSDRWWVNLDLSAFTNKPVTTTHILALYSRTFCFPVTEQLPHGFSFTLGCFHSILHCSLYVVILLNPPTDALYLVRWPIFRHFVSLLLFAYHDSTRTFALVGIYEW